MSNGGHAHGKNTDLRIGNSTASSSDGGSFDDKSVIASDLGFIDARALLRGSGPFAIEKQ